MITSYVLQPKKLNYITDISNFLPITNNSENTLIGNIYTYDSKLYVSYNDKVSLKNIASSSITPLFANNYYVICESSSNLKLIKFKEDDSVQELTITSLSIKKDILNFVDVVGDYVYFYAKPNSKATNYYLHRVNLKENLEDKKTFTSELIGTLKESDKESKSSSN